MAEAVSVVEVAPSLPDVEIGSQIDFNHLSINAPTYKYRQIQQNNGQGSRLNLSASETQSNFLLPQGIFNLGKSYFNFVLNVPVGASNYNVVWTDQIPMREITLQQKGGQVLANIQDVAPWSKTARFMQTDMKEYLSREAALFGGGAAGVANDNATALAACRNTQNMFCQPAHAQIQAQGVSLTVGPANVNGSGSAPVNSYFADVTNGAAMAPSAFFANVANLSYTPTLASGQDVNESGPQHYSFSTASDQNGAAASAGSIICRIDLDAFKGTLLSMNKDIISNGQLEIIIRWRPLSYWGVNCTVAGANPVAFTSGYLNNYYLYLAEDINPESQMVTREKLMGGSMFVPYTVCSSLSCPPGSNGNNFSINVRIPGETGLALKRIVTVPVNASNNLTTTANCDNTNQVKYSQLQSKINGKPCSSDFFLDDTGVCQTFGYIYPLIKNSPLGLSNRTWHISNCWVDNFSKLTNDSIEFNYDDYKLNGLKTGDGDNYEISFKITSTGALTFYTYCVWVRELKCSSDGKLYY